MNKIFERLLYGTNIDIENINKLIYIVESADNLITITQFDKGFSLFESNKKYFPLINEYIENFQGKLFTPEAIRFFCTKFRLCDEENPYDYIYYIYGIDDINKLNTKCIYPTTVKIDISSIRQGITDRFENYYFKNLCSDFLYFGTVINGEIVSLTGTTPNEMNFKAVGLSYETLPEHRNKGYAKSNTAAIIDYLLKNDFAVVFNVGLNNIASINTVKALGLQRYGCQLTFFT